MDATRALVEQGAEVVRICRVMTDAKVVAYSSLAILVALYVVGAVGVPPGSLRHEVQTLPLWFPIVAGHFFPTEIAMTLVVGGASLVGLWAGFAGERRFARY